jgi:hypothetical protein
MRQRCLASFVLLGVVITGCSSSGTHAAAPPPVVRSSAATPSPVASPTPSPSATPFLSAATEAGAYAFVKAYFAELDRAYASGDVSKLAPYRQATCSCLGFERDIRSYYGRGGKIVGEKTFIDKWSLGDHGPAFARAGILFHTSDVTNTLPGRADSVTKSESGIFALDLRRVSNTWIFSDIRYGPAPA